MEKIKLFLFCRFYACYLRYPHAPFSSSFSRLPSIVILSRRLGIQLQRNHGESRKEWIPELSLTAPSRMTERKKIVILAHSAGIHYGQVLEELGPQ